MKWLTLFCFLCAFSAQAANSGKRTLAYQHYSHGVELTAKKKWEEALKNFQMAIDLNPGYIASYIEYARTAVMTGNRAKGLEKLTAALSFAKGREEKERLLTERDNLSEVFYTNETFQQYQNGLNYLRLERSNSALESLEKARKVEPDNLLILYSYAKALQAEDRQKDALAILEKAHALNERNREVRLDLADAFLVKEPERTLAVLKPVLSDLQDERLALLQARALSASKRNREAIDFLRERADRQQSWLLSQFWLGKLYSQESDGNWNARKYLMTFLKRSDDSEKKDDPSLVPTRWKAARAEAELLLARVNRALE